MIFDSLFYDLSNIYWSNNQTFRSISWDFLWYSSYQLKFCIISWLFLPLLLLTINLDPLKLRQVYLTLKSCQLFSQQTACTVTWSKLRFSILNHTPTRLFNVYSIPEEKTVKLSSSKYFDRSAIIYLFYQIKLCLWTWTHT